MEQGGGQRLVGGRVPEHFLRVVSEPGLVHAPDSSSQEAWVSAAQLSDGGLEPLAPLLTG